MALCGLCEVLFDVDNGNQVEHCWPPGAFSEEELGDIAFTAFPDSMSMELSSRSAVRDSCYAFRLRRRCPPPGAPPHPFLYGHVFCRQRHDERLRRGCEQRSVVLLSFLPLLGLLEPLARLVGPAALSYGPDTLQEVYREVHQHWPCLEWGCRTDLPVLGLGSLQLHLPMLTSLPTSALPAAVAATLVDHPGAHLPEEQQQQQQQPGGPLAPAAGGLHAGAAAGDAGHPATASPAEVAAALADELDEATGIPLCLLPDAYGQQELEPSPFGDCDCFTPLRGVLPQLWALWELLLLGQPLMVVAPSPGACSAAVAALLSLLAPFPYSLDWRPYFTIHDATFPRLAAGETPTAANGLPMLLGLTNLYFLKALPEWPNVLSTGYTAATLAPSASNDRLDEAANGSTGGNGSSSGGGLQPSESAASIASSMGSSMAGGGGGAGRGPPPSSSGSWLGGTLRRTPASPAALLSGPVDHCWLQYKPHSRPDKTVLDRLVQPQPSDPADKWRRLAAVNNGMLRRHFQELTKALLFPLLPYLSPTLPPEPQAGQRADPKAAEAAAEPPPLPQLDPAALLEQLAGRDAVLPEVLLERFGGKKGLLAFYERFLRSPNLAAFMHTRRIAAEEWQRQRWDAASAAAAAPMRELLSVEAFFRIEQQLAAARVQLATAGGGGGASAGGGEAAAVAALASQLQEQLQLAFAGLPEDLQQAILQTPSHSDLLGGGDSRQEQQAGEGG
ncbi:DENND6A-like [Chlorella sorokiniana]|uniref:DENND6A-like n=1 Tax=Chlorella sorokiniana TaxID=3076 RepID=A0A2P6TQ12_CHLSO|nr:DENND6A-like [Chlorella sorokiniana]|eukprot:PRW56114.1 DENND6A-like [Chlorella sorokiniana]